MMSSCRLLLTAHCLLPAASSSPNLSQHFDTQRAFAHVQKQVQFGPRPSGSQALQKTRDYLTSELRSYGMEVQEQAFEEETPHGRLRFVNILAAIPSSFPSSLFQKNKTVTIVASHYDAKWLPKIQFVGANDGASSTGALLEIARVVAQTKFQPPNSRVEFVLFDGEEAVEEYSSTDGLYGSRHYIAEAKSKSRDGKITNIKAMILMDMIGDRDLSVQIPQGHPDLTKRVFNASEALGFRDFFHYLPHPIMDDHYPFFLAGIPAINLIDFEYGPNHRWWHSEEDTVDKISPDSLKIVGQVVLKMLEAF